jgi:hypothetical protein
MILENFDFENYQGEDLIFAVGAPGSKWSGLLNALTFHKNINDGDKADHRQYFIYYKQAETGQVLRMGWHFGVYFGPGNEHGENFDDMSKLSKEEIVREFAKPYESWDGVKIIKSHWFAYNLDVIEKYFPKAKIILVWAPDESCFDWWTHLGGWNITFPVYTWYDNNERMKTQIKEENAWILKFIFEKNLKIIKGGIKEVCTLLDFDTSTDSFKEFDPTDLSKNISKVTDNNVDLSPLGSLNQLIGHTLYTVYDPAKQSGPHPVLSLIDNVFAKRNIHSVESLIPLGDKYDGV